MWNSIIEVVITSVVGLIGVLIGAYLSRKSTKYQEQKRFLAEYYAEVLSAYSVCMMDETSAEKKMNLIAAIEKAKLFCSHESEELLIELEHAITDEPRNTSKCGGVIRRLIESAKNDVRN